MSWELYHDTTELGEAEEWDKDDDKEDDDGVR